MTSCLGGARPRSQGASPHSIDVISEEPTRGAGGKNPAFLVSTMATIQRPPTAKEFVIRSVLVWREAADTLVDCEEDLSATIVDCEERVSLIDLLPASAGPRGGSEG